MRASGTQEARWKLGTQGGSQGSSIQNKWAKKKIKEEIKEENGGEWKTAGRNHSSNRASPGGIPLNGRSTVLLLEVQPRIDKAWILVKQTLTLVELIDSTLTY